MQTFRKKERLCNFSSINTLFAEGHSFFIHPFKIVWMETSPEIDCHAQLLISVPKRNFKRAVDRNLIKRQIREAFRHNKEEFYSFLSAQNRSCSLAVVFVARNKVPYSELNATLISALKRLMKELTIATRPNTVN